MVRRIACAFAIVTLFCHCSDVRDDEAAVSGDYTLAASAPIRMTVSGAGQPVTANGEVSLQLHYSKALAGEGWLELRGASFVLNDYRPPSSTGAPADAAGKGEELGIAVSGKELPARLTYDVRTRTASGTLRVEAHYPQLDTIYRREPILELARAVKAATGKAASEQRDVVPTRRQLGTLNVQIVYDAPLEESLDSIGNSRRIGRLKARLRTSGDFGELQGDSANAGAFSVSSPSEPLTVLAGNSGTSQVVRTLCIQPVIVRAAQGALGEAGRGWNYGRENAEPLWRKAGIAFDVRPPITVNDSSFRTISTDEQLIQLMGNANVDKCVEIFFIEQFEDPATLGGGLTFKGGTERAKIVTSDVLADEPDDVMHLAHELGHVLNLGHPGDPGDHFDSSTNTLMCPSEFRADNPQRMSRDNADHISSPLLTDTVQPKTTAFDCNNSADCGACPP